MNVKLLVLQMFGPWPRLAASVWEPAAKPRTLARHGGLCWARQLSVLSLSGTFSVLHMVLTYCKITVFIQFESLTSNMGSE